MSMIIGCDFRRCKYPFSKPEYYKKRCFINIGILWIADKNMAGYAAFRA